MFDHFFIGAGFMARDAASLARSSMRAGVASFANGVTGAAQAAASLVASAAHSAWNRVPAMTTAAGAPPLKQRVTVTRMEVPLPPPCPSFYALYDLLKRIQASNLEEKDRDKCAQEIICFLDRTESEMTHFFQRIPQLAQAVIAVRQNPFDARVVNHFLSGMDNWQSRIMVDTMSFGRALICSVSGMPSAEQCMGVERLHEICPQLASLPREVPFWGRILRSGAGYVLPTVATEGMVRAAVDGAQGLMLSAPPLSQSLPVTSSSSSSSLPAVEQPWLTHFMAEKLADVVLGAVGGDETRRAWIMSFVENALSQQVAQTPVEQDPQQQEPWLVNGIASSIANQVVGAFGGSSEVRQAIFDRVTGLCQLQVNRVLGIRSSEEPSPLMAPQPMQGRFIAGLVASTARAVVNQVGGGPEVERALQCMMQGAFNDGMRSVLGLPPVHPERAPEVVGEAPMEGALASRMATGVARVFVNMFGGGDQAFQYVHRGLMGMFASGRDQALGRAAPEVPVEVREEAPVHGRFIPWISAQAADFVVGCLGGGEAARAAVETYIHRQASGYRDQALGIGAPPIQEPRRRPEAPEHGALTGVISGAIGTAAATLFGGGEALRSEMEERSRRWLEGQIQSRITGVAAPVIHGCELPPIQIPDGPFPAELLALRFALKELYRAKEDERAQIDYETCVLIYLLQGKYPWLRTMALFQLERTLSAWFDREKKRELEQKEGVPAILWDEAKGRFLGDKNPMALLDPELATYFRSYISQQGCTFSLLEKKAEESRNPGWVARGAEAAFGAPGREIVDRVLHPQSGSQDKGSVLGRFFSEMSAYLKSTRPDQKAVQFAAGWAIGQVDEALQGTSLNPEDIRELFQLRQALEQAQQGGKLEDAVRCIQKALTYHGVLPNPPPYDLRAPVFSMPKTAVQETLSAEAVRLSTEVEAKRFVHNTKHFATIAMLYSVFASGNAKKRDPIDVVRIIQSASDRCSSEDINKMEGQIKAVFFAYLSKRSTFFGYVFAKVLYPVICYVLGFTLKHFTDSTLHWINRAIEKQKSIHANTLPNVLVEGAQDYCGILLDIFRRIGTDPHRIVSGGLNHEIEKELDRPEYHGGITTNELYQQMGAYLIDKFLPNFGWPKKVKKGCQAFAGLFPNRLQKPAFYCASFLMMPVSMTVHIGQWALSKLIGVIAKQSIKRLSIVETVVSTGIEGLKFNGYAHALNTLLKEQLEQLLQILEDHYNPHKPKHEEERDASYAGAVTAVYRDNLKSLIPQAARVVARSAARSVDELKEMYLHPSVKQRVVDGVQDIFVRGRVLENAIVQVADAIETLIAPSKLQQTTADALRVVNASFSSGAQVDPQEFKETEEEVSHLMGRIVHKLLKEETEAALDLNKTREMAQANRLNEDLKKESGLLYDDLLEVYNMGAGIDLMTPLLQKHEKLLKDLQNSFLAAKKKGMIGTKVESILHGRLHKLGELLKMWNEEPYISTLSAILNGLYQLNQSMMPIVLKPSLEWLPGREGISTQAAAALDGEIYRQVEVAIEAMRSKTYNVKGIVNLICRKILGIKIAPSPLSSAKEPSKST